ncbi:MAG TPA: tetratricopeptide repeat protein [Pseudonocardia sp.]|nr:tetratricopeptide repeat protein [Pseudonocardia sp.]
MGSVRATWPNRGADRSRTGRDPDGTRARPSVVNAAAASFLASAPSSRDVAFGERVLLDCDKVLGFEHPDTVAVATGLAAAHQAAGRPEMANPLYTAALDVRRRTLGDDHPDTLSLIAALAQIEDEVERAGHERS